MSETEQEWKPKARPQSTMAQAFSSALDSAFSLDSNVNDLSLSIDQKKQQMMIQSRELEALQERIREAEERLKRQSPTDEKLSRGPQRQTPVPCQESESISASITSSSKPQQE